MLWVEFLNIKIAGRKVWYYNIKGLLRIMQLKYVKTNCYKKAKILKEWNQIKRGKTL